jgi:dTDP-4-amino-4,6-dideoxygalactose transaminase
MSARKIPSTKGYFSGREAEYVNEVIALADVSSDGKFTKACASFLEERLAIQKVLMTPSCTAALEMAALLSGLGAGDEVIIPSFTFSSTANAVLRTGALPVFVDITADTLTIDCNLIEAAITERTKAIIPVHYAGVACNMDAVMKIAKKHKLIVIEDAAQGVNAFWKNKSLGSIGNLGAFSFHSTKNYICGEGGALCINSPELVEQAEIIREKGTNRGQFIRNEVDRYTWVGVGSSYLPSELSCAFLYAQLEMMEWSTRRRREVHRHYDRQLKPLQKAGLIDLPFISSDVDSNHHIYYLLTRDHATRESLLTFLQRGGIGASSHFQPLHSSPMGVKLGQRAGQLPVTESVAQRLIRLPIYPQLSQDEQQYITGRISYFLQSRALQAPKRKARAR